jgi:hypothetical protein
VFYQNPGNNHHFWNGSATIIAGVTGATVVYDEQTMFAPPAPSLSVNLEASLEREAFFYWPFNLSVSGRTAE